MPSPKPDSKKAANTGEKAQARTAVKSAGGNLKKEFDDWKGDIKSSFLCLLQKIEKFKDVVKNNYELGRTHLTLGNLKDAQLRFKFVLWLEPAHVDAMYYLGVTYMAMGNKKQAVQWFDKALKLRPGFEEAKYLLCVANNKAISGDAMPKNMPPVLAKEFFDSIADDYNFQALEELGYEGHTQLDNLLRTCITPGRIDCVVLELGVGTGLCGPGIRDVASHLTGIDISSKMLDWAMIVVDNNEKKIYDALLNREAIEFLTQSNASSYDIIMSAGMLSYIGDLERVFQLVNLILKDKGLFAFTVERWDGEGYQFQPEDARFHYSRTYIENLAAAQGFTELKFREESLAADSEAWVCVYQKK